jgi:hypothetical protein
MTLLCLEEYGDMRELTTDMRELTTSELDVVAGGFFNTTLFSNNVSANGSFNFLSNFNGNGSGNVGSITNVAVGFIV